MNSKKSQQKSVLVTGAGNGFGICHCKNACQKNGWIVFGTIIPSQSPGELEKLGITPIVTDITARESVEDCYKVVESKVGEAGLSALVNVARLAGVAGELLKVFGRQNQSIF
jgi:NAD(P)-dependent dehydrogenase (short-subunit alcohol dehydrogenase family)